MKNAIEKAIHQVQPKNEQLSVLQESISAPNQLPKKISLHTLDKIVVVSLDEIIRCQSDNNYTTFYFENGTKLMVTKTLKFYADLLKDNSFLRVHQSHLVNTKYIKEFIKSDGGYLVLKDKSTVSVSVRKRAEVIEMLSKF